jgi:hypothetical protein
MVILRHNDLHRLPWQGYVTKHVTNFRVADELLLSLRLQIHAPEQVGEARV